jgi:hypothetical protein
MAKNIINKRNKTPPTINKINIDEKLSYYDLTTIKESTISLDSESIYSYYKCV